MAIDWTKNFRRYKGKWVAMLDDEQTVVASGKSAKEAWDMAKKKGHNLPILFHVPTKILPYVGSFGL